MAQKRALVVDDSKSARVILSRMLEKYDIEVDMAESAEQAIEYLKHDRPDAIFMDHLMPGMDGLQAVQAIKGNPQTAMIPIMMYTSQEGELYVGQARALGAMGVLPKQVRPVDVSKVLYELHLLPDRRDMDEPALLPVELDAGTALERPAAADRALRRRTGGAASRRPSNSSPSTCAASSWRASTVLRSGSSPICATRRPRPPRPRRCNPCSPRSAGPLWPWAAASCAACVLALMCALLWTTSREELAKSRAELAAMRAANADLQRSRDRTQRDGQGSDRRARGRGGEHFRRGDFGRECPGSAPGCRDPSKFHTVKYPSITAAWMCCATCWRNSKRRVSTGW